MKQLFISGGQVLVREVIRPLLDARGILVETHAAAISVGTETQSLLQARQKLLNQFRSAEFRSKVLRKFHDGTLWPALRRRFGMGAPIYPPRADLGVSTGYSCAGRVLEVGQKVHDIQPGIAVACVGSPHAEIVYVPQNLFVPTPSGISDAEAAFVALGSIALHAVRQAQLTCGEVVIVMGLGVIGQLVEQLARVNGARTIGTDLIAGRVELARRAGSHLALNPSNEDIVGQVLEFTNGLGADAIILCMGGNSPQPIKQALHHIRDRGRLVVVGTPRMDIPREPFYRKEIELRIARSYGPGRYDPAYEEEGLDYPVGYVRWTERRNMAEFLQLVAENRVDVASLITHQFPFDQAPQAYETALSDSDAALGIVLKRQEIQGQVRPLPEPLMPDCQIGVAVVGAGSFARSYHLPNISRTKELHLRTVVTSHRRSAEQSGTEFGAEVYVTDFAKVLVDPAVDLVVIATPHHLHAPQTIAALEAGKAVFCEKPMGMTRDEVDQVVETVESTGGFYAIGFNRRFAPAVVRAKELLVGRKGPLVLNYRVMGTFLPADHWVYDPVCGGGRIIGEACHFFDLLCFLIESKPLKLTAQGGVLSHPGRELEDNLLCEMTFSDGSIASLVYGDLGHPHVPKERLEIFAGEGVLLLDHDFSELKVYGYSGQRQKRILQDAKGFRAELAAVTEAVLHGQPSPIGAGAGWQAMQCSFSCVDALRSGRVQELDV